MQIIAFHKSWKFNFQTRCARFARPSCRCELCVRDRNRRKRRGEDDRTCSFRKLNSQSCIGGAVLRKRPRAIYLFLHHDSTISYPPIANRYWHDTGPLKAASAIRGGIRESIRTNPLQDRAHYWPNILLNYITIFIYFTENKYPTVN